MIFRALLVSSVFVPSLSIYAIPGEMDRITRDGIQTCYMGAQSIREVLEVLKEAGDLAKLDPIPLVPTELEDPSPNPSDWRIDNPYAFRGPYVWKPADQDAIRSDQFPYGKITYGSGVKILNLPHIQGTMYRAYVPKNSDELGLTQVTEEHRAIGLFSKTRYLPAFAFQKFSLWTMKDRPGEIYLADHADDSLHLLWKKISSPEGGQDYWYNTISDQIWSEEFKDLNINLLNPKITRLDTAFGVKGFRIPKSRDYRLGAEMSVQHILPGYSDPGKYMAFGQLSGPVQYWVEDSRNSEILGSFYADEREYLEQHWTKRSKISSKTNRRARFVLNVSDLSPEEQSKIRSSFGLQPMAKSVAENIMKRRHDPRAVVPMTKKKG